jgi:hypothetical protein
VLDAVLDATVLGAPAVPSDIGARTLTILGWCVGVVWIATVCVRLV